MALVCSVSETCVEYGQILECLLKHSFGKIALN